MTRLLAWLLGSNKSGGTEERIRRGIMIVVVAAVALTAVPVLIVSVLEASKTERRHEQLVGEFVARNLADKLDQLRTEITILAEAPIVGTALTDSAGREAYLRPFLQQRADALNVDITLRDYRGRPLLQLTAPEVDRLEAGLRPPPSVQVEEFSSAGYVVIAPITLFQADRVIGVLEARVPWPHLLQGAASRHGPELRLALYFDQTPLAANGQSGFENDLPDRIVVRRLTEGATLTLGYGPSSTLFLGFYGWLAAVVLVINMLGVVLASAAARAMAHSLTTPLSHLVDASRRFSVGEIPNMADMQGVREIAELSDALTQAFAARDTAQREMRLYTERLLEGLPVVVFTGRTASDGSLSVDYLSPGVTRVFGWSSEELSGADRFRRRFSAANQAKLAQALCQLYHSGAVPNELEFELERANGTLAWVSMLARITGWDDGEAVVAGTLVDVTRERSLRVQAITAAKLSTLGEMATGLAHELNQPIAVMSLAAENTRTMLERRGASYIPEAVSRMNRIVTQAARARTIIDHLRIFGHGDAGELKPLHLRQIADGALILVGGQLRQADIALSVTLPETLPMVLAQLVPAEQALVNLLLNARDALLDAHTEQPEIHLVADIVAETVVLKVQDNGPGFPPEVIDRVFEPFFTTKDVGKGTGLGLSICHGIMRSFGGSISAGVSPLGGAELRLTFQNSG